MYVCIYIYIYIYIYLSRTRRSPRILSGPVPKSITYSAIIYTSNDNSNK